MKFINHEPRVGRGVPTEPMVDFELIPNGSLGQVALPMNHPAQENDI
jgi:hypothetical protein